MKFDVTFIDQQAEFDTAMASIANAPWIGFDTEFVGEKTFIPVLCLIQVVADERIFLIDSLRIKQLKTFLDIVENPDVLKITHAGDNDYRLLYTLFGTIPKNTFDTQIAAGFVGYNYPAGFGKLCERELRISLAKSHTVADWEARPLDPKALNYAVEDVQFLPALWKKLTDKLGRKKRIDWAREENQKWEIASTYLFDSVKEATSTEMIHQLDRDSQVFLIRLYRWRREKAQDLNVPKEVVLQNRHISPVVRAVRDGEQGFRSNRTINESVWRKHIQDWLALRKKPITEEENAVIKALPQPSGEDPMREWSHDLLYTLIRKQCLECEISPALLMPKGDFNKLKNDPDNFNKELLEGWRSELLGPTLTQWIYDNVELSVDWQTGFCKILEK